MNTWYDVICEIMLNWAVVTLAICGIIAFTAFVIDKLRERKEMRKILSEKYIRYRIDRWNYRGY